ncbi:MAG: hypothetical protein ACLT9P_02360 [Evtepia gabavorous]
MVDRLVIQAGHRSAGSPTSVETAA